MNDLLKRLNMEPISDFFDECYEKALKEPGIPFWLTKEFILETDASFPYFKTHLNAVIDALDEVTKNEDLVLFAKTLYIMLEVQKHHEQVFPGLEFPKAPDGENTLGYDIFAFYPMLARIKQTCERLKASGVDDQILLKTYSGIDGNITAASKRVGRFAYNTLYFLWCTTHKNGDLFKMGRFSYEIRSEIKLKIRAFKNKSGDTKILMVENISVHKSGFILGTVDAKDSDGSFKTSYKETDEYYEGNAVDATSSTVENKLTKLYKDEWEMFYAPGDTLVSIHIPADGSFDPQIVEDSLNDAKDFFRKLFPDKNIKGYMCISWLLAPELDNLLKPTSNILSFKNRFTRFPVLCGGLDVFNFIFTKSVSSVDDVDLDSLPQNSSLEKNVVAHYKAGKYVHETGGVIPF